MLIARSLPHVNEFPDFLLTDCIIRAPVCQSTRTRKMQAVTRKTANSLTSGRRRAIIRVQQQAFALFSPAYQSDHDARHGRLFSFAVLPASREARMRRHMRRISQAEGSAWLSPPSGQIPGWNGVKPAAVHRKDFRPLHSITDNVVCQSVVCFDSIFCRHRAASAC